MGKFSCYCGNLISDTSYPCAWVGDLTWQPEADRNSNDASLAIKEFFAAVEAGEKEKWLLEFFDMGGRSRFNPMERDRSVRSKTTST